METCNDVIDMQCSVNDFPSQDLFCCHWHWDDQCQSSWSRLVIVPTRNSQLGNTLRWWWVEMAGILSPEMFDGDSVFLRIHSVCYQGAGGEVGWVKFSNGDLVTYLHSLQGGAIKKDYVCGMKNGETYILARQEREFWPAGDHNGCHCPHNEGDSTERGADVTLLTINNR